MRIAIITAVATIAGLTGFLVATYSSAQTAPQPAAQSATAGKAVFERYCVSCHSVDGNNDTAPTLKGISGRRVGGVKYPAYSDALKAANKKGDLWSDERLEAYISHPDAVYKGTAMSVRIQSPTNRANLMAYLKTLK